MRTIHCALIAMALVATGGPAIARDQLGSTALQAGNLGQAERILIAERLANPDMPELMLNLAYVYRHTGREAQARALYREVLTRPEVMLDTAPPTRSVSSYAVARAALSEPQMSRVSY